jgi:hypothetical protein
MTDNFIFHGPPADRERVRARVQRAYVHQSTLKRDMSLNPFTTLEDELKRNYVSVKPDGELLRVEVNPAENPSWELTFTIDEHDHMTNMVAATIAPEPNRSR